MHFLLFCVSSIFTVRFALASCMQESRFRQYYKVKNCHRSEANLVGRTSVSSLKECVEYAREKNALAFNFSPPEVSRKLQKKSGVNCQTLGCPELHNFTSLIVDSLFDYYSSYGNASVLENATCIKCIGVFALNLEKLNYSEAIEKCQERYGDLAHILSEVRTVSLAKLLLPMDDWYKAAYIGLDDREQEGKFETPLGDPIDCYKYRAWSPGHPRHKIKSDDCVILSDDRTWRVVNCKHKLASMCELYPTPAVKSLSKYLHAVCDDFDDSAERDTCRAYKIQKRKPKHKQNRCIDDLEKF